MTNRSDNSMESAARLAGFRNAGNTMKPDDLGGAPFTIVESQTVLRRDGSSGHKWIVSHDDGTLGMYWAAGMAPPHQVAQWFRQNPGKPLHVRLTRSEDGSGYTRWDLVQIGQDDHLGEAAASDEEADALAAQVPF